MFLIGNKGGDFDWFYWMMFFVLWAVALISGLIFIVPHVRKAPLRKAAAHGSNSIFPIFTRSEGAEASWPN